MKIEVAAKGLIIQNGKYLALERKKGSNFELPGGRLEFGETLEETLIREIKEETNLNVLPKKVIATWNFVSQEECWQITGVVYLCEIKDVQIEVCLSDEHEDYRWVDLADTTCLNWFWKPIMDKWDWDELK